MDPQLRVGEPKHFRNASLFGVVTQLILFVILGPPTFGLGYLLGFLASELCNYFPRYLGEVWHFQALLLVSLILFSVVWVMFIRYLGVCCVTLYIRFGVRYERVAWKITDS